MTRGLVALLAPLVAAGLVPAAAGAKEFRGKTGQDRSAYVLTGADGLPQRVVIDWRARCRRGRYTARTRFSPPFDAATPDSLSDDGTYRVRQRGGIRIRVTARLRGTRVLDPARPELERWQGTLSAKVLVKRRGRYLDTCRLRPVRWRARLLPS